MFSIKKIPLGKAPYDESCVVCWNWPWHRLYCVGSWRCTLATNKTSVVELLKF